MLPRCTIPLMDLHLAEMATAVKPDPRHWVRAVHQHAAGRANRLRPEPHAGTVGGTYVEFKSLR